MEILNRKRLSGPWPSGARYIGRGTPLGNPYAIGPDGDRETVIARYRQYLSAEIERGNTGIIDALRALREDTPLVCSCAPAPCHGEVIRDVWSERFAERPLVRVFPTRIDGRHGEAGPTAQLALKAYGAQPGQGEGASGSSYALAVCNRIGQAESIEAIGERVRRLFEYAQAHPELAFRLDLPEAELVGWSDNLIAPLFRFAPDNCRLPERWGERPPHGYEHRLLIAGSRTFENAEAMERTLDYLTQNLARPGLCVLNGLARGADSLGGAWAERRGVAVSEFPAHWAPGGDPHARVRQGTRGPYNTRSGHNRNVAMAVAATHAVLFWDGQSSGTAHMANLLRRYGVNTRMVRTDQLPQAETRPGEACSSVPVQESLGLGLR